MQEQIRIPASGDKETIYNALMPQIQALIKDEPDPIANMANTAASLKQAFDFFWVGFYLVKKNELVLGPFQGPVACTRISYGRGVCGTSWEKKEIIIVPDVDQFPGHIACSSESRSEIVIPGILGNRVVFVLDIDSDQINAFTETDSHYLGKIVSEILQRSHF